MLRRWDEALLPTFLPFLSCYQSMKVMWCGVERLNLKWVLCWKVIGKKSHWRHSWHQHMMLSRSHDPLLDIHFFVGTTCIAVWMSTAVLWMLMPLAHRNSKAFPGPRSVVDRQLAFSYNQEVEKVSTTNFSSWMSSLRLLPYRDPVTRFVLPSHSTACSEGTEFPGCSWFSIRERSRSQRFCVCVCCFFTPQCPSQVKDKEVQV